MIKFIILYFIIGLICLFSYLMRGYLSYDRLYSAEEYIDNLDDTDYGLCLAILLIWPAFLATFIFVYGIRSVCKSLIKLIDYITDSRRNKK